MIYNKIEQMGFSNWDEIKNKYDINDYEHVK